MPRRRRGVGRRAIGGRPTGNGAWYDPLQLDDGTTMCVHGNPNAVTEDRPTSSLSQGCAGQQARVEIELFVGPLPPIRAHEPPTMVARSEAGVV